MDEITPQLVSIRADTAGFARDVDAMRASLDPLTTGADRTGRLLSASLLKAVETGKLGFGDLQKTALSALDAIAASALKSGLSALLGGGGEGLGGVLAGLIGAPGRATGGPVSPGRAYVVGERGPELFVPTSSGTVATAAPSAARDVRVAITINGPASTAPAMLQQSSRQVARAVKAALEP